MDDLLLDVFRFGHFIGLALGLGLAFYADFRVLRNFGAPLSRRESDFIHMIHGPLVFAVLVLWASGLGILVLKTGLDPALISAKLCAKLIVVTILTANAWALAKYVLPVLDSAVGKPIWRLPTERFAQVMVFGAISATSWTLALCLGVFSIAKQLPAEILFGFIGASYSCAVLGAIVIAHLPRMLEGVELREAIRIKI